MPVKSSSNARRHPYLLMKNWKGEGDVDLRFWLPQTENHQSYTEEQREQLEEGLYSIPIRPNGFIKVVNDQEHRKIERKK